MNAAAVQASSPSPLRVAIVTSAGRRARLAQLVQAAGHLLVDPSHAQVFLCEGEIALTRAPSVMLGRSDQAHAGQLSQEATAEQIDAALRAVAAGLIVRQSRSAPRAFEELPDHIASELLTPRELDVLTAISEGMSNKAVARKLGISLHTVKFHVESLFRKLGARTRAEAVTRGLERRRAETVEI